MSLGGRLLEAQAKEQRSFEAFSKRPHDRPDLRPFLCGARHAEDAARTASLRVSEETHFCEVGWLQSFCGALQRHFGQGTDGRLPQLAVASRPALTFWPSQASRLTTLRHGGHLSGRHVSASRSLAGQSRKARAVPFSDSSDSCGASHGPCQPGAKALHDQVSLRKCTPPRLQSFPWEPLNRMAIILHPTRPNGTRPMWPFAIFSGDWK